MKLSAISILTYPRNQRHFICWSAIVQWNPDFSNPRYLEPPDWLGPNFVSLGIDFS